MPIQRRDDAVMAFKGGSVICDWQYDYLVPLNMRNDSDNADNEPPLRT